MLIMEHIGMPKHKCPNKNPYGAGKGSGKHAKPDAILAATNARAHTKAAKCSPLALLPICSYSHPPVLHSTHSHSHSLLLHPMCNCSHPSLQHSMHNCTQYMPLQYTFLYCPHLDSSTHITILCIHLTHSSLLLRSFCL